MTEADPRAPGAPLRRGVPAVVWALVVLHALLLLAWTVLVPAWRAPDEPHHLDMAFAARTGQGWPGPGDRQLTARITGTFPLTGFAFEGVRDLPPLRADAAVPRGARPAFPAVAPDVPSGAANWLWQHPPLYYAGLGSVLAAVEALVPGAGGWSFDRELGVARALTALLVAWVPLLAWAAADRLGASRPAAISAAVLVLAVPQLSHIGSTVTNDGLLVLLLGLLTVHVAAFASGDASMRTAVRAGVVAGLALLTKGFALLAFGWLPLAGLLAVRTAGRGRALRATAVAVGGAALLGGWWTVRNLVVHGAVQPSDFRTGAPEGFTPDALAWASTFARWMVERFWGAFGWYQAALPRPLVWAAALLLAAVVGVAVTRRDAGPGTRADRLLLLVPTAALLAVVGYGAWGLHARTGFFAAIQGRYLLPGLVGLAAVAGGGIVRLAGRRARAAPLVVLAVAVVMQAAAWTVVVRRFWAAEGGGRVEALLAWSPWPTWVHAVVAVGIAAALVTVLTLLLVESRRAPAGLPVDAGRAPAGLPVDAGRAPAGLPVDAGRAPADLPVDAGAALSGRGAAVPALGRVAGWARGVPVVVWLLVVCHLGLLTGYAVLVPTWRAPDEPQHADMAVAVRDGGGWPDRGERRMTAQIIRSYDHARFDFAGRRAEPRLEAPDAVPRADRPTFAAIAADEEVGSRNGQFQHPPLHAVAVATTLTIAMSVVPGAQGWSYDLVVVLMRLVSAAMVAPLPLLAYLTARRLRLRESVATAAAAFPLAIPMLTHIGAAVNPDASLVLTVGLATVALAGVAAGDLRRRSAVLVGLACGVALLAKGFALFLPAMALAAYGVAARGLGGRRAAARAALAGVVALGVGGWWWLRNLVRFGSVQPTGAAIPPAPDGFAASLGEWLGAVVTLLPQRWWGSFGWYQVDLPAAAVWVATALVVAAVAAALIRGPGSALDPALDSAGGATDPVAPVPLATGRPQLFVLLVPLVGIAGIVAVGAWGYYAASSLTPGLQGRYLFPAVTGLAVVVAVGAAGLADRWLPVLVLGAAAALQAIAVAVIALRWYGIPGVRSPAATLAGFLAWSPWGRPGLVLVLVLVLAGGGGAVALLIRAARAPGGVPRPRTARAARARGR